MEILRLKKSTTNEFKICWRPNKICMKNARTFHHEEKSRQTICGHLMRM